MVSRAVCSHNFNNFLVVQIVLALTGVYARQRYSWDRRVVATIMLAADIMVWKKVYN